MTQPKVEIFSAPMCSLCHEAMHWFEEQGIPYKAYELEWEGGGFVDSPAARDLRQRVGDVEFVPQIFINGRHIAGWRSMSELIRTGEIKDILAGR